MVDWLKILWRGLIPVGAGTAVESTGRDGVSRKRRERGLLVRSCVRAYVWFERECGVIRGRSFVTPLVCGFPGVGSIFGLLLGLVGLCV